MKEGREGGRAGGDEEEETQRERCLEGGGRTSDKCACDLSVYVMS